MDQDEWVLVAVVVVIAVALCASAQGWRLLGQ